MHFNVAVRVPGHLPIIKACKLATAAMKARHICFCREEVALWDGFGPALGKTRQECEERVACFLVVDENRPADRRNKRWHTHQDECVFHWEDAEADALLAQWRAEHPNDYVFIYDVHA